MTRLRLIHETNPQKYFPALFELGERGKVTITGAHRYSVAKEWLRAWHRDRSPLATRTANALADLKFRLGLRAVRGEVIVMGYAPWDPRILLYRGLAKRNQIIYHTSWHDWRVDCTPRQPKPKAFKRWLRDQWRAFLRHPNVRIVAVTPMVAKAVNAEVGVEATVIPHAAPQVFFDAARKRAPRKEELRLLYVGELSEKKGIPQLLDLMKEMAGQDISLTVVGNGALSVRVQAAGGNVTYLGPIWDRSRLAELMSQHDVLVLFSHRTATWEELFGIVVIEALAAGMAVVATNHVGPRGILAPVNGAGLFAEDDMVGISALIGEMIRDRRRLVALQQSQQCVAPQYQIDAVCRQWHDVINQTAEIHGKQSDYGV